GGAGGFPLGAGGGGAGGLRPGESTWAGGGPGGGIFHVIEGPGESRIGDETLAWERGDCIAAPPGHWIQHRNLSAAAPACLFQVSDEPALRALGLWLEEERV